MTFSEYIIQERSEYFLFTSMTDMVKYNQDITLEKWFSDIYYDYKLLDMINKDKL